MSDARKVKISIVGQGDDEIKDAGAMCSCPKYKFQAVQISTICTKCEFFGGIKPAVDTRSGSVAKSGQWHRDYAVTCAFPLQRQIHPVVKVIK